MTAIVECRMCNSVGCPYCRGAIPTFRSVLAHRQTFQDARGIQQSSPIRPALSDCAPTQALSFDQVAGRSSDHRVTGVVHAPEATGARLADVPEVPSIPPENE
jgi:hypothetical protein